MSRPSLATQIGFYGVFYLVFVLITVVGYGPAQEYTSPITNLIFPQYTGNSLVKTVVVISLFYWGAVLFKIFVLQKNDQK